MTPELQKKVDRSIRLIQSFEKMAHDNGSKIELCFSGGKDSCVIKRLADMAGIKYTPIYKNTTIDPKGNVAFCKSQGCEVLQPKETFFHLVHKKGLPSRWTRFCCHYLKEYKVPGYDYQIIGIRASESTARAKRYKEPEQCRVYSKTEKARQLMPILYWTLDDVKEFIESENIQLHPLYYREDGTIDYNKRLGCVGCPLVADNGVSQFKENPKMLRQWLKAFVVWWDNHPGTKTRTRFRNPYEVMVYKLFFAKGAKKRDEFNAMQYGLFEPLDCKQYLEEYFGIDLTF